MDAPGNDVGGLASFRHRGDGATRAVLTAGSMSKLADFIFMPVVLDAGHAKPLTFWNDCHAQAVICEALEALQGRELDCRKFRADAGVLSF